MFTAVFMTITGDGNVEYKQKCKSIEEAKFVINTIADFSNFEIDNKLKLDYSSVAWIEDKDGNDIDEEDDNDEE